METRQGCNKKDYVTYGTERLREEFLIDGLFQKDEIKLVYSMIDRIITGGTMATTKGVTLVAGEELRCKYFLERREMGIINIGGNGYVMADGVRYDMKKRDCLYLGRGVKEIAFYGVTDENPALFYLNCVPAHKSYPNMVIIRTYLQGLSESLLEAARLDGAGEVTILVKILLPLSMPVVATVLLWSAVSHWNNWTDTMYFIKNKDLYTLQYNLQMMTKETQMVEQMVADAIASGRPLGDIDSDISGESIQAAQLIFTTLPIVCVYPFIQKYFITGITLGGVKE